MPVPQIIQKNRFYCIRITVHFFYIKIVIIRFLYIKKNFIELKFTLFSHFKGERERMGIGLLLKE